MSDNTDVPISDETLGQEPEIQEEQQDLGVPEVEEPKFVTEETFTQQLNALGRQVAQSVEGLRRYIQSDGDRQQAVIDKKLQAIDQKVSQWRQQGYQVSDQAIRDAKAEVQKEHLLMNDEQPNQPGIPPEVVGAINTANRIAEQKYKNAGIYVYENDEEFKLIDMSSPETYITSLDGAIEAKKKRVGKGKPQAQTKKPATPTSPLTIRGKAGSGLENINDPDELIGDWIKDYRSKT